MAKRIMTTLSLVGVLTLGQTGAMENPNNPNPDTVDRIVGLIQTYGFKENTPKTKEIILDALQGVMATDEQIGEAFQKVNSQEKEIAQEEQIPQEQKTRGKLGRELTATEKENAYKMWLMKQALEKGEKAGPLPVVPSEVQGVIGQTLHDLSANPVLNGTLEYTMYNGEKQPFKIMDILNKDGTSINLDKLDENGKKIFGDASKYLLITTDPEQFFNIVKNSNRFVILIAPRFLIEGKIGQPCCTSFKSIMANWKEEQAPIGIFYRMEDWKDLKWYNYLTDANLSTISKKNLHACWSLSVAADVRPHDRDSEEWVRIARGADMRYARLINLMFILT